MNIDYDYLEDEWIIRYNTGQEQYLAPGSFSRAQALMALDEILDEALVDEI